MNLKVIRDRWPSFPPYGLMGKIWATFAEPPLCVWLHFWKRRYQSGERAHLPPCRSQPGQRPVWRHHELAEIGHIYFNHETRDNIFLRKVHIHLQYCTVSQSRKAHCTRSPPSNPKTALSRVFRIKWGPPCAKFKGAYELPKRAWAFRPFTQDKKEERKDGAWI